MLVQGKVIEHENPLSFDFGEKDDYEFSININEEDLVQMTPSCLTDLAVLVN